MVRGEDTGASAKAEVWKPIPSADGYLASSLGRVRRNAPGAIPLMGDTDRDGYQRVLIGGRHRRVNRLVCEAFHGQPTAEQCAHLDGDLRNNSPTNLAWVTRSENEAHKELHGTKPKPQFVKERITRPTAAASGRWVKLTDDDVAAMRAAHAMGATAAALAREYYVCKRTAQRIVRQEARVG